LIPPTQRNLLYIDNLLEERQEFKPKNYCPVNFYEPDYERFPEFANVRGKMYVKLNEGDLLYLPAFWWHHVKSARNKNIAINFWYTPNFMLVNLMGGLDANFHEVNKEL